MCRYTHFPVEEAWLKCWAFWQFIGVLSVGAIAGYSKAMMKYRLNKQAEQLSQIINAGLRYAGKWNLNYGTGTATNLTPYLIKLGEIPKEMIKSNNTYHIYDIFGTLIYFTYTDDANQDYMDPIQLFMFPDTSSGSEDALSICRNIMNVTKEFHQHLFYVSAMSGTTGHYDASSYFGDDYCTNSRKCIKDVTVTDIDEICRYNIGKTETPHIKLVWFE